jgi:arginyl-tRNA synthetase
MNLFDDIRSAVIDALGALARDGALPGGLDLGNVAVEPPRDAAHGDMATNAAMVLAKPAGQKPRDIAEALAGHLARDPRIASAEVAGPGFLNLRLAPQTWRDLVLAALARGDEFGKSTLGAGRKVNVEFVSANPTGPMHVGHTRGAVFGDALARLMEFAGHDGDAGILHQRRRRAGRCARAVGLPALPRGARPGRGPRMAPIPATTSFRWARR